MDEFFEPPPPPKVVIEFLPPQEWDSPPRDAVPAIVPIERVIAQNDAVGVFLACLWVYPAGFQFEVFVVAKDESTKLNPFDLDYQYEAEQAGEIPPGKLRLGFLFADGTKITNTGSRFEWAGEPGSSPKKPIMKTSQWGGGEGDWSCTLWVWPIPPPGPLQFVCEWPEGGIPLTYTDLDSAAIIEAAARSTVLFPGA